MDRPYTICHILSALDGRITGPFMHTEGARDAGASYARIRSDCQADAWVYGSTTTKEFVPAAAPYTRSLSTDFQSDFAAETDARLYYVSIDPLGEIGWSSPTFVRPGCPDAHVIEVLIEDTPAAYRGYLHERGISYITCGRHALDCQLLAQKLYALFGVRTMLVCGGGTLNWTFLEQNALDELSLLLAPAADGLPASPAVFQRSAFSQCDQAFSFRLKEVRQLDQDVIHLIYTIDPKKG